MKHIITRSLRQSPAVAILGPRQVGKTTQVLEVAKTMSSVYLDLENKEYCRKTPTISIGFHIACDDLKAKKKLVVYSGDDTFEYSNGTTVLSLYHILDQLKQQDRCIH